MVASVPATDTADTAAIDDGSRLPALRTAWATWLRAGIARMEAQRAAACFLLLSLLVLVVRLHRRLPPAARTATGLARPPARPPAVELTSSASSRPSAESEGKRPSSSVLPRPLPAPAGPRPEAAEEGMGTTAAVQEI